MRYKQTKHKLAKLWRAQGEIADFWKRWADYNPPGLGRKYLYKRIKFVENATWQKNSTHIQGWE